MTSRENYPNGFIGITSTDGIIDINNTYSIPNVLSTSTNDNSTNITLPINIVKNNIIILVGGSRLNINTPSGYTELGKNTTNNPRFGIYYKIAEGNEGGTTIGLLSDSGVTACMVLSHGVLLSSNNANVTSSSGSTVTLPAFGKAIKNSLVFLCSCCDQSAVDPSNNGGFSNVVIDAANNGGGTAKEIFVWSKIYDGVDISSINVTWGSARTTAFIFYVL